MRASKAFFPGKVIISGEHSVVYGEKALVASLDLGIEVILREGNLEKKWQEEDQYLQGLFRIFESFYSKKIGDFSLEINSNLAQQSGLGSSAALAAAVFQALADFNKISLSKDQLFNLTLKAENLIHSNSSGVDPAIVINQGLLIYQKIGSEVKMEQLCSSFKAIFSLINSGKATENTGEMVNKVRNNSKSKEIVKKIGKITKKIITSFKNNDFNPRLLDQNQVCLEEIGVVGRKAKEIILFLRENGASAKITGAGGLNAGSGYILAWHKNFEKFSKILESNNLDFFPIQLGFKE